MVQPVSSVNDSYFHIAPSTQSLRPPWKCSSCLTAHTAPGQAAKGSAAAKGNHRENATQLPACWCILLLAAALHSQGSLREQNALHRCRLSPPADRAVLAARCSSPCPRGSKGAAKARRESVPIWEDTAEWLAFVEVADLRSSGRGLCSPSCPPCRPWSQLQKLFPLSRGQQGKLPAVPSSGWLLQPLEMWPSLFESALAFLQHQRPFLPGHPVPWFPQKPAYGRSESSPSLAP